MKQCLVGAWLASVLWSVMCVVSGQTLEAIYFVLLAILLDSVSADF